MTLTLNVKTAKLQIDGVDVPVTRGKATLSLTEGTHQVVVTSAGRAPLTKDIEVTATTTKLALELARAGRPTTTKSLGTTTTTPTTPKTTPTTPSNHKDDTIDPFK